MTRSGSAIAVLLSGVLFSATAHAAGPPDGYKHEDKYDAVSPDKSTTVEQYVKENADDPWSWQFWARHGDSFTLLAPVQDDYPAYFTFTNDSAWAVRMQKTGSGEATMYLYHLTPKERRKLGVKELPGSLAEALTELEKDEVIKSALGDTLYEAFARAKWQEWDDYRLRISDYEIERYLETA